MVMSERSPQTNYADLEDDKYAAVYRLARGGIRRTGRWEDYGDEPATPADESSASIVQTDATSTEFAEDDSHIIRGRD